MQLPFSYDDAGNMRSKKLTAESSLVFTHDAWNRLVGVRRTSIHNTTSERFVEYHYNGLHQRIAKRLDTSEPNASGYGEFDRQHKYFYTAAWQIAEELIDNNWAEMGPGNIDQTIRYVWGIRYIDDIILRSSHSLGGIDPEGNYRHYHLTDHQFSTVALIDNSAKLLERVTYDAYGNARHHWAADITGTGAVTVCLRLRGEHAI